MERFVCAYLAIKHELELTTKKRIQVSNQATAIFQIFILISLVWFGLVL